MTPAPRQLLDRFQQAMLDFSADALAGLFAADAVYEFVFWTPSRGPDQRYEGREEIRAGFGAAWSTAVNPVRRFRETRVHETTDPEVIISEHEIDAVDHATGREFVHRFLFVLRARDGEIVHLRDYADALRVSAGLGRLPQLFDRARDALG